MSSYCSKCGAKAAAEAKFCADCGAALDDDTATGTPAAALNDAAPASGLRLPFGIKPGDELHCWRTSPAASSCCS